MTKLEALKELADMTVVTSAAEKKKRDSLVQGITGLILDKPEEPFTRMQIIKHGLTMMRQECISHRECEECPLKKFCKDIDGLDGLYPDCFDLDLIEEN